MAMRGPPMRIVSGDTLSAILVARYLGRMALAHVAHVW